jgi:hypothetical protein
MSTVDQNEFWHQVGHALYDHWPSQRQQRWETFYDQFRQGPEGFLLSRRVRESATEAFCERFAALVRDAQLLTDFREFSKSDKEMWMMVLEEFITKRPIGYALQINLTDGTRWLTVANSYLSNDDFDAALFLIGRERSGQVPRLLHQQSALFARQALSAGLCPF